MKGKEGSRLRRRLQAKRLAPAGGTTASASLADTAGPKSPESLQQDNGAAAGGVRSSSRRGREIRGLNLGEGQGIAVGEGWGIAVGKGRVIAATDADSVAVAGVAEQLLAVWDAIGKLSDAQASMGKQRDLIDEAANESQTEHGNQDSGAIDEYYAQKWAGWKSLLPLAAARQQLRVSLGVPGMMAPLSSFSKNLNRTDAQLSGSSWSFASSAGLEGTPTHLSISTESTNPDGASSCCAPGRLVEQQQPQGVAWSWDGTGLLQEMPVLRGPLGAAIPQVLLQGLLGADAKELPHALATALEQGPQLAGAGLAAQVEGLISKEVELGQEQQRACELAALQLLLKAGAVKATWAAAAGVTKQGSPVGLMGLLAEHAKLPLTERKEVTL